jgi:hypothetical protein
MADGDKTKVMQLLLEMEMVIKNLSSNGDRLHRTEQHRTGNRMAGQMDGREKLGLEALASDNCCGIKANLGYDT